MAKKQPKQTQMAEALTEAGCLQSAVAEMNYLADNPDTHAQSQKAGANLTGLMSILQHEHGRNVAGRLGYNLNFIAARHVRQELRRQLTESKKTDAERKAETDVSQFFGFTENDATNMTLDRACHYQFVTWLYVMDISHYTEADERGMKSKPFAWMGEIVKNPIGMIHSDARYGQSQQVAQQVVNMAKLGMDKDTMESAQMLYDGETKAQAEARVQEKLAFISGALRDMHYYKNLGTDELYSEIEAMVAELGIDVPKLMIEIATDYKISAIGRASGGKFIGEIDEQLLAYIPGYVPTKLKEDIVDREAAAMEKFRAKQAADTAQVAVATATSATKAAAGKMRRVPKGTVQH